MEYKKLLLNMAISAIIGVILGLSLYKLFLGVTVCFIAYIMHETWNIGIENYFGFAICLLQHFSLYGYSLYLTFNI